MPAPPVFVAAIFDEGPKRSGKPFVYGFDDENNIKILGDAEFLAGQGKCQVASRSADQNVILRVFDEVIAKDFESLYHVMSPIIFSNACSTRSSLDPRRAR